MNGPDFLEMQRRIDDLERWLHALDVDVGGGSGTRRYIAIDLIRGPDDISTVGSVSLPLSVQYNAGSVPTTVPTLDPSDTAAADIPGKNLGWGTRRDTDEVVWIACVANPGSGNVTGVSVDIYNGASGLTSESVQLPADDTPGSTAEVFIIDRMI